MGYTQGKISINICLSIYYVAESWFFIFHFYLSCSLRKSDYLIYKLSISPFFNSPDYQKPSPSEQLKNIFLALTDRDQLSCIEYDYTCRIFVFCCDSTWLLPYKQPWALKITLFSMISWVYLPWDHLLQVMAF